MHKNKKVLIVDDMEVMRTIFRESLEYIGFREIHAVSSVREALSLLKKHYYDLVLSDFYMPELTGIDLLHAIRKEKNLSHLKVLIVSAHADEQSIQSAILAGADGFLVKPFTPNLLKDKIKKLFSDCEIKPDNIYLDLAKEDMQDLTNLPGFNLLSLDKAKVLVVDDEPINLQTMLHVLKNRHLVLIADNGQKCLEICYGLNPPDLVLLDALMPKMSGYEVCNALKHNERTKDIPVIFLSALDDTDNVKRALEVGAIDFIHKPVDPFVLQLKVANHLSFKIRLDTYKQERNSLLNKLNDKV
jgi:CheY-like chemotaxis protein